MAMPKPYCSVDDCWNTEGHLFPMNPTLRKKWLLAIKKCNSTRIAPDAIVCLEHFTVEDYVKEGFVGTRPLVKDAVPSVFHWYQNSDLLIVEESSNHLKRKIESEQEAPKRKLSLQSSSNKVLPHHYKRSTTYKTVASQTQNQALLSHLNFINKPAYIIFYTGLDSHEKFSYVYSTLGPTDDHLGHHAASVPLEDQFFLTLMKLRRNTPDIELALFFNISMEIVQNIVVSWIPFMASEWSELNSWPSKNLINYYNKEVIDSMGKCQEKDSIDPDFPQMDSQLSDDWSIIQKGCSKSLYVERLVGRTKIYEILRHKLKGYCEPFEREIRFICAMLCHYRQSLL